MGKLLFCLSAAILIIGYSQERGPPLQMPRQIIDLANHINPNFDYFVTSFSNRWILEDYIKSFLSPINLMVFYQSGIFEHADFYQHERGDMDCNTDKYVAIL